MQLIHKTFPLWVALGIASRPRSASRSTGTWRGAFEAALWGGAVRIFLAHHVTWSINSVCHFFGTPPLRRRRPLDQRLLARPALDGRVLAPQPPHVPALGVPRPAALGDRPDGLGDPRDAAVKLAWNVVEITPERQREKLA